MKGVVYDSAVPPLHMDRTPNVKLVYCVTVCWAAAMEAKASTAIVIRAWNRIGLSPLQTRTLN